MADLSPKVSLEQKCNATKEELKNELGLKLLSDCSLCLKSGFRVPVGYHKSAAAAPGPGRTVVFQLVSDDGKIQDRRTIANVNASTAGTIISTVADFEWTMMEALVEDSNGGLACVSPTAPLKQAGDTVWIVPNQKAKQALAGNPKGGTKRSSPSGDVDAGPNKRGTTIAIRQRKVSTKNPNASGYYEYKCCVSGAEESMDSKFHVSGRSSLQAAHMLPVEFDRANGGGKFVDAMQAFHKNHPKVLWPSDIVPSALRDVNDPRNILILDEGLHHKYDKFVFYFDPETKELRPGFNFVHATHSSTVAKYFGSVPDEQGVDELSRVPDWMYECYYDEWYLPHWREQAKERTGRCGWCNRSINSTKTCSTCERRLHSMEAAQCVDAFGFKQNGQCKDCTASETWYEPACVVERTIKSIDIAEQKSNDK